MIPFKNGSSDQRLPAGLPALGVAAFALVVAAGSGAAAGSIVTAQSLPAGSVTSRAIKDGTIVSKDISADTRRRLTIVGGYQLRRFESSDVATGAAGSVSGVCPAGTHVLGAMADWATGFDPVGAQLTSSTAATAFGRNSTDGADRVVLWLTCGRAAGPGVARIATTTAKAEP